MKYAAAIVWGQWRAISRRPVNLIYILVLPLAMVMVFAGIYRSGEGGDFTIGVVRHSDGPVSERLVAEFESGSATVSVFDDQEAAERAVRRRSIEAVVIIPASVDDTSGSTDDVELVGAPGVADPGGLRTHIQLGVARVGALVVMAERNTPDDPLDVGLERAERDAADAGIEWVQPDNSNRVRNDNARALFGILVLFTFMNVLAGAGDLTSLREMGVLSRLRATPLGDGRIVAGFIGFLALYGLLQAGILAVGGTVLLGIRWEHPFAMIPALVMIALAAASLSALLSTFLPAYPVGTSVAGGIGFALGMLGGCLWTLDIVSPTLRTIGHLTPQAWSIEALMSTMSGTGTTGLVRPLVVLAAFTVVTGALATVFIRRRVTSTI